MTNQSPASAGPRGAHSWSGAQAPATGTAAFAAESSPPALYRSEVGRTAVMELYERTLRKLTIDHEIKRVPIAIYAARDDIFFPGDALMEEAHKIIPNLSETAVFDSSHFPTKAMQIEVTRRVASFL